MFEMGQVKFRLLARVADQIPESSNTIHQSADAAMLYFELAGRRETS
jgi:hypothetical protein